MADLRSSVEAEVDAKRAEAVEELEVWKQTQKDDLDAFIVSRRHELAVAEAATVAAVREANERVGSLLSAAQQEAERTRRTAEQEAENRRRTAAEESRELVERANRILSVAKDEAQTLREQTMTELEQLHSEHYTKLRTDREAAKRDVEKARAEAEHARADARRRLRDARDEVKALSRQRDEITSQLNKLSGVIEALAAPGKNELGDR